MKYQITNIIKTVMEIETTCYNSHLNLKNKRRKYQLHTAMIPEIQKCLMNSIKMILLFKNKNYVINVNYLLISLSCTYAFLYLIFLYFYFKHKIYIHLSQVIIFNIYFFRFNIFLSCLFFSCFNIY